MRIVQLLSGGFDSVGQAILLQSQGHKIYPMYVRFRVGGGKQVKEEAAVVRVSETCNFTTPYIHTHRIPKDQYGTRNRQLCMLASVYATSIGISHVAIGSQLFDGVELHGNILRDDLDPKHLQRAVPDGITVLPGQMWKAALLKAIPANMRKVMFESTSCQMWFKDECGKCFACVERHAAFLVAMGYDYTQYTMDPKVSTKWPEHLTNEAKAFANYQETQNDAAQDSPTN